MEENTGTAQIPVTDIAIVGMAGRFPGAKDIEQFWHNVRSGIESISTFSDQEVLESGVPEELVKHPRYVKFCGVLDDADLFDAAFFNYSPVEATLMDPQHRHFLECAYEALEYAGYDSWRYEGRIGVYGGAGANSYLLLNLLPHFHLYHDATRLLIGNEKDFLTSRVSFQLNLRGPSISLQAGCSTSLFAIHVACQALQNGECDMALAGGVSIITPQKAGFLYQDGGIWCSDGHCRAFDARANGTLPGNGVGVVVLKRMADALADHDHIHAIIKGSAIANDGQTKVSFSAPSIAGEAMAIADALMLGDINPETVTYIEAHGTATSLGDPIEVAALNQVFQASTSKKQFCALGSVKTNIGHLDAAAGVVGLIKTVMALEQKELPPSLHFEHPNPYIDFATSPFYVNSRLAPWNSPDGPRRAGVSSFSVGGQNAHVVLEEAPERPPSGPSRPWQLLLLSAKTASALETATTRLMHHLQAHTHLALADVSFTLQTGRRALPHRRAILCQDRENALQVLGSLDPERVFTSQQNQQAPGVAFLFPGQGTQYVHMAVGLYQNEPIFREEVDRCAELLKPWLNLDIRNVMYPDPSQAAEMANLLAKAQYAQIAIFVVEYALARLWLSWGMEPRAMIGHSIGEYTAACLAGVFSLAAALELIAFRGVLMQSLPLGAMLAVALPENIARLLIEEPLCIAAVNGPAQCVISGSVLEVERLQQRLQAHGVENQRLHVSHAMHSSMMESILARFEARVKQVELKSPTIPFVSCITGNWITATEATDPSYWSQHLRQTVRFSDGLQTLFQGDTHILLEVGPGRALSTLARRHPERKPEQVIVQSLRHSNEQQEDMAYLLIALGKLWLAGASVNFADFYTYESRYRVPLPSYPFERQRYWMDPLASSASEERTPVTEAEVSSPFSTIPSVPQQVKARRQISTPYIAPQSAIEQTITAIWQQSFGVQPIGIHDNFFELGGHSMMALQLNNELRDRFAIDLSLRSFLSEFPTVARLARAIEELQMKEPSIHPSPA